MNLLSYRCSKKQLLKENVIYKSVNYRYSLKKQSKLTKKLYNYKNGNLFWYGKEHQ